jgi:AcrR family transcriptional regulator
MKHRSEQGRITREKLLAATDAMLVEFGWEATTAQAIQQRTGISQGSWSHAFRDGKVETAAEVYAAIHREIWSGVLEPFGTGAGRNASAVIPVMPAAGAVGEAECGDAVERMTARKPSLISTSAPCERTAKFSIVGYRDIRPLRG